MFNPLSAFGFARGYSPVPQPTLKPEVNPEGVTVVYRWRTDSPGKCGGCQTPYNIGDLLTSLPSAAPEKRVVLCSTCAEKLGEAA